MASVLHLLPHGGGGAETYLDLLEGIDGYDHERAAFSNSRELVRAVPSIAGRWPGIARRARRADLLHAHGDVATLLALPLLKARPSVWVPHGLHLLRRADGACGRAVREGVRAAIGATAVTLCSSHAEREELAALARPELHDRLDVIYNGIELPPEDPPLRAAARAELGLAAGDVAVLYLGRLEERKDPLTAVRAAARAAADGAPLVLLVAGDGPLYDAVRTEDGPAVRVLGFRSDAPRLLAAADAFVLPSRREGMSFAVLEAMARGLAMVVADGPGNGEAVGAGGVVLPAGDVGAFAAALGELARDPARRAALGAAARERIARELTVDRLRAGVLAGYERALTAPSRAASAAPA
jgi:glycosyltransferase involved in cell wall biosynthesis